MKLSTFVTVVGLAAATIPSGDVPLPPLGCVWCMQYEALWPASVWTITSSIKRPLT